MKLKSTVLFSFILFSDGIERLVAFSQYPQYSCTTSGSSFNAIADHYFAPKRGGLAGVDIIEAPPSHSTGVVSPPGPIISFIDRWPVMPLFIVSMAEIIQREIARMPEPYNSRATVLLFSAHSLPMSNINKGDPYIPVS